MEQVPVFGRALLPEALQFHELALSYREALNLLLLACAIISIQVSLNLLGAERPVFWRESRYFSIGAYLLGKNLAHLPLTATYPFVFLLFAYQLIRPYAPFQAFYLVFLTVQWAGEGIGQLISLQLNSSRQLAGGIAALISTVLTGSFPLLSGMGLAVSIFSYLSICRWGMVALLSIEFAPWYLGDPTLHSQGCCAWPQPANTTPAPSNADTLIRMLRELPTHCETGATHLAPSSRQGVFELLNASYGYEAWVPRLLRLPGAVNHSVVVDIYPLPGSVRATEPGRYHATDPGFSQSAVAAMAMLGLGVRVLVYFSLRHLDRRRRR